MFSACGMSVYVGLFCLLVGLFCLLVGLFCLLVGLFCMIVGLFARSRRPSLTHIRRFRHTHMSHHHTHMSHQHTHHHTHINGCNACHIIIYLYTSVTSSYTSIPLYLCHIIIHGDVTYVYGGLTFQNKPFVCVFKTKHTHTHSARPLPRRRSKRCWGRWRSSGVRRRRYDDVTYVYDDVTHSQKSVP